MIIGHKSFIAICLVFSFSVNVCYKSSETCHTDSRDLTGHVDQLMPRAEHAQNGNLPRFQYTMGPGPVPTTAI